MKDSDGNVIKAGDTIVFYYGLPPIRVEAPIISRGGKLIALTEGHTPKEIELKKLKTFSEFWKRES